MAATGYAAVAKRDGEWRAVYACRGGGALVRLKRRIVNVLFQGVANRARTAQFVRSLPDAEAFYGT